MAAGALTRAITERLLARAGAGLEQRKSLPDDWRSATGFDQMTLYVTPEEMKALNDELVEIVGRYRDRIADPAKRPPGSRAIGHLAFAYPVDP